MALLIMCLTTLPIQPEKKLQSVLVDLKKISDILLKWFTENYLKANPEKYHIVQSTNHEFSLKVQDLAISNSR